MSATRLLVVADSKMLPSLAGGLRASGRVEIATAPLAPSSELAPLVGSADLVAIFYGSRQFPLDAALRELAPSVRERGARLVAVLQRDQTSTRDDCFRAGASDLLFMPMPKDQFVVRLHEASLLSFVSDKGLPADLTITAVGQSFRVSSATVAFGGVVGARAQNASAGPAWALKIGETVQVGWSAGSGSFARWGLVAHCDGEVLRVRFAGSTLEEDAQLRAWLEGGVAPAPRPPTLPPQTTVEMKTVADLPGVPPTLVETKSFGASGPPPGFAARPPIRPQVARAAPSTPRPQSLDEAPPKKPSLDGVKPGAAQSPSTEARASRGSTSAGAAVRSTESALAKPPSIAKTPNPDLKSSPAGAPPKIIPSAPAPAASAKPASVKSSSLESLFDDESTAAPDATAAAPAAPEEVVHLQLDDWPTPLDKAVSRSLMERMLREKDLPPELPAQPAAAVRKVIHSLPSSEREALEAMAADSHLHEALHARVLLASANLDGAKLVETGAGALVDDAAVAQLTGSADAAVARLQAEADRAITKGEVEVLQQVTAASAALSRELLSFKETADRLRGLAAAPRLGAGALDPNVVAPDEVARPVSFRRDKSEARAEQRRSRLSDFTGLQDTPRAKQQKRALLIAFVVLIASLVNAIWFAGPSVKIAPPPLIEQAGTGVLQISLSPPSAIVAVASTWLTAQDRKVRLRRICDALRPRGVKRLVVYLDGHRGMVGQIDVTACEGIGLPKVPAPPLDPGNLPAAPH